MELPIEVVATPIIGVMPFLIGLLVCWYCSSWRRWLAAVLALITGCIFLFEVYSASVSGNLTGLLWMLSLPVVLVATVVLYLMEKLARQLKKQETATADQDSGSTDL